MNEATPLLFVECDRHGKRTAAVVCRHLVATMGPSVGFIENSSEPGDLQAWCGACEAKFLEEGDKTDAFERFNDSVIVCTECYAFIKSHHSTKD